MLERGVAGTFVRWTWMRAVFHRGWWLVASVYLVVVAELSASELVLYGATMSVTMLLAELPTGVLADTVSRKWSLVIAHAVMGTGMVLLGLVTAFPLILVTQLFWGLGWTFASGADVAWLTDELDQPGRVARVLLARARWELVGSACGLVAFGALAWAAGLSVAIVTAGSGMIALGLLVATRFPERRFVPARAHRWRRSWAIFRRGAALARGDREIGVVFAATLLVNGGAVGFGFLYPKRLLALGLPSVPDPIVWFTALGLVVLAVGALALRFAEARIDEPGATARLYRTAASIGAIGVLVLAVAPEDVSAMAGVLLMGGIGEPVTRSVSVIWVNRRSTTDVRATVHSFLSQAEVLGEILAGLSLAAVARVAGLTTVLLCACVLVALAAMLVVRSPANSAARCARPG